MTQAALSPAQIDDLLGRARDMLQQTRFPQAAALCQQVLDADPKHKDALYTLAVTYRYQGDYKRALATNDHLIAMDPSFGRAYQERGHCPLLNFLKINLIISTPCRPNF